jgi:hypothetical protein
MENAATVTASKAPPDDKLREAIQFARFVGNAWPFRKLNPR